MMMLFAKSYKYVVVQFIVLLCLSAVGWFWRGKLSCISLFLGGLSWLLPTLFFVLGLRQIKAKMDNKTMLRWFFLNELIKWVLSLLMIIVFVLACKLQMASFLLGYITIVATSVVASFMIGLK